MLLLISDYIQLIRKLIKLAKGHGVNEDIIKNLLDQKTRYHGEFLKARRFLDIVEGRFQIDEVIRVNRENDEHTISAKIYDFSVATINQLFELGYNDALNGFNEYIGSSKEDQQQREESNS